MVGDKYTYMPGVDTLTGCYMTAFDAAHAGLKCTMLYPGSKKAFVLFGTGEEAIVDSDDLVQILEITEEEC